MVFLFIHILKKITYFFQDLDQKWFPTQHTMPINTLGRNHHIDRIRGLSILAVLTTHGGNLIYLSSFFPKKQLSNLSDGGMYGVIIFFTISGFLITRNTLLRYGQLSKLNLKEFYIMRIARIIPPLLLFILIMYMMSFLGVDKFTLPSISMLNGAVYSALTFQYNYYYFIANVPGMIQWAPLWSLSIEEMFYIFYPLTCIVTRRTSLLIALLLGIVVYGPFIRHHFVGIFNYFGSADFLSIGCLAAIISSRIPILNNKQLISIALRFIGALTIAFVFLFASSRENYTFTPSLLAMGAALFLIGSTLVTFSQSKFRLINLLMWPFELLGKQSYEIYLFHMAIIIKISDPLNAFLLSLKLLNPASIILSQLLLLSIIILVCIFISKTFSEPLNKKIRNGFNPKKDVIQLSQHNISLPAAKLIDLA